MLFPNRGDLSPATKCQQLNILPLEQMFKYNVCTLVYKIASGYCPEYLQNILQVSNANNRQNLYRLPLPRIDLYKSSFAFFAANSLSPEHKTHSSCSSFKFNVKRH